MAKAIEVSRLRSARLANADAEVYGRRHLAGLAGFAVEVAGHGSDLAGGRTGRAQAVAKYLPKQRSGTRATGWAAPC